MHYPFKSVGSLADEFRQTDKQQRQSLILDDHPNQSSQVPQIAQPLRMLSPSSLSLWNLGQTALPTICHRAYLPTVHGHKSVVGHIKIGPRSVISARSGVINSLEGGRQCVGHSVVPVIQEKRQLPELLKRARELGNRLGAGEQAYVYEPTLVIAPRRLPPDKSCLPSRSRILLFFLNDSKHVLDCIPQFPFKRFKRWTNTLSASTSPCFLICSARRRIARTNISPDTMREPRPMRERDHKLPYWPHTTSTTIGPNQIDP
mgnify:CR=1 FL=1